MELLFLVLGCLLLIPGLVCSIIILIDAFQDEVWKGVLVLICGLYGLYYSLIEFDHERKWLIVLGAFAGSGFAAFFFRLAGFDT